MLTDVPVQEFTPEQLAIAQEHDFDASTLLPHREQLGVYMGGLNCEGYFEEGRVMHGWYGVADSIEQILAHHADLVDHPEKKYVVVVTPIFREHQPERGGWRWRKWGEYIGTREITREYLYDQPEIDHVFVYHVYGVKA